MVVSALRSTVFLTDLLMSLLEVMGREGDGGRLNERESQREGG